MHGTKVHQLLIIAGLMTVMRHHEAMFRALL